MSISFHSFIEVPLTKIKSGRKALKEREEITVEKEITEKLMKFMRRDYQQ